MADSTRDMRRSVYERDVKPKFENVKLAEITHEDVQMPSWHGGHPPRQSMHVRS